MKTDIIQKRIGILIFERCQIVDATGAAGVFGAANEILKDAGHPAPFYDLCFIAPSAGAVRTSAGVSLFADMPLSSRHAVFDTFICAGGKGTQTLIEDDKAVAARRPFRMPALARMKAPVQTETMRDARPATLATAATALSSSISV